MRLLTVEQIRGLEKKADELGLSYQEMMKRAATGLAQIISTRFGNLKNTSTVIGLAGPGNNGGDTLLALMLLQQTGWSTRVITFFRNQADDPVQAGYLMSGGTIIRYDEENPIDEIFPPAIIVDGILGTGTTLPIRPRMRKVLDDVWAQFGQKTFTRIAVDCPSGMDCDNGEVDGHILSAEITVCMAGIKLGLIQPGVSAIVGELVTVPIGLDEVLPGWSESLPRVMDTAEVARLLPARPSSGHKGIFGTVCVIGGMENYPGAPVLAGKAAYQTGCGLVQMAIPENVYHIMPGSFLEAIWLPLEQSNGGISPTAAPKVMYAIKTVQAVVIGPGIGRLESTGQFIESILFSLKSIHNNFDTGAESRDLKGVVIDADGLQALSKIPQWWEKIPHGCVLTPHPGEMSTLTGLSVSEIQQNRVDICREYAQKWGQIVVLKGAGTVIAHWDGRVAVIPISTSALSHAGTGDVLAGMIASLIAQGLLAFDAAACACWIHARAGQLAAKGKGSPASVLAGDVIDSIGHVLADFWPPE
jgi:ADP-dependent NAD(P)H-hydrate dehydratase / NAD(P)H-hydrate epimerase